MLIMTDEEIESLKQRPIDDLSDDELMLIAERALKLEAERRAAEHDEDQRLAFMHLREVVADALAESSQHSAGK